MNKIINKILIGLIIFCGIGLIPAGFAMAQNLDDLIVIFTPNPLFLEANFLPGQVVSGQVEICNKSGKDQRIAVEAINAFDGGLGNVLKLEIKEGTDVCYSSPLSTFFNNREISLSDTCSILSNNSTTTYNFLVNFYSGAGNYFQSKTLGFDILIGFQGEEGGILPGAGSGSGGFLPAGLTIQSDSITTISTQTTVVITWLTSYESTSQVVYGTDFGVFDLMTKPNYGYPNAAPVPEDFAKVVAHSVTITGLLPSTTYYYRCISHASPATIGREHSFTTLAVGEGDEGKSSDGAEDDDFSEEDDYLPGGLAVDMVAGLGDSTIEGGLEGVSGEEIGEEEVDEEIKEDDEEKGGEGEDAQDESYDNSFLAGIAGLGSSLGGWLIIIAVILLLAAILIVIRKRRKG